MSKIRCLHARRDTEVLLEVDVSTAKDSKLWTYTIGFNIPASGSRIPTVTREIVKVITRDGTEQVLLQRPNPDDRIDPVQLQQTYLEQINTNGKFRELGSFLGDITYVHLVPQLLKFGAQIGGKTLDSDPFGQEFMLRIARTPRKTREVRLRRIQVGLQAIVLNLHDLRFVQDPDSGHPHLEIRFLHHRPRGAKQQEDQFSDGTLRLISLLWLLQDSGDGPILLEEPELSLNEEIVKELPLVFSKIRGKIKNPRQVILTTHSWMLLDNPGIDRSGIVVVHPSLDGSTIGKTTAEEDQALSAGFSPAEVVMPRARRVSETGQLKFEF